MSKWLCRIVREVLNIYDNVLRNLNLIGEAVKNIPGKVRESYPKLLWREIAGFRDICIYECFGIDEEILWDII
jgi:uncharacterized protein with HEPN domain